MVLLFNKGVLAYSTITPVRIMRLNDCCNIHLPIREADYFSTTVFSNKYSLIGDDIFPFSLSVFISHLFQILIWNKYSSGTMFLYVAFQLITCTFITLKASFELAFLILITHLNSK